MRIAEVAPPWLATPPSGYGGIELVVALLADGLVERGHDVTLFATGDSKTRARLEYEFDRAPGPGHINDIYMDAIHAARAFEQPHRFDVVHVHAPFAALAAGVASGRPVVHTVHGSFTEDMRRLYRRVADRVRFVAISESQRSFMPELPYAGVVPNGIDTEAYPFRDDEEKEDFLLFVGRAAPEKGARLAALAARETGLPLVMAVKVAEPHERRYWDDEVIPVLPPETDVRSDLTHEEKAQLMGSARAVLFPIDWDEPFGLVMAEAMACGTPVIATSRGAAPEVVAHGETGFIVPVEDYPRHAAEAFERIGDISAKDCRRRVEDRFSKEAMVSGYERAFEHAVRLDSPDADATMV
jgi:glycosyltransferase involved in cell wall biosynthesis